MKKSVIIIGVIFAILVIVGLYGYNTIFSSKTVVAQLHIESGTVEVDTGKGWISAVDNMRLSLSDKIKTSANGKASLILYESVIINLKESTEILISELDLESIKINQEKGKTWNKFTDLAGVKSLEVETPTTVATVRGTEFGVGFEDGTATVIVAEGVVDVESEGKSLTLTDFEKAVKLAGEDLQKAELTPEERAEIIKDAKQSLENLKDVRMLEIEKNKALLDKAKAEYDITDAEILDYLAQIDSGELDDAELIEQSPVKTESMYKVKAINDQIKEQNKLIEEIEIEQEPEPNAAE